MAEGPLIVKSKAFALEVIQVCEDLRTANIISEARFKEKGEQLCI